MPAATNTEIAIWERLIHPDGAMTRETARKILELDFSDEERRRMSELAAANQAGTLTTSQQVEMDNYCRVGTLLSAMKSRARRVLKDRRRAS